MHIKAEEISQIIRDQIKDFDKKVAMEEVGTVISAGDGIAKVYGLDNVMAGELVEFPGGVYGMTLNLEEDNVGVVIMGDYLGIKEGDTVKRTIFIVSVDIPHMGNPVFLRCQCDHCIFSKTLLHDSFRFLMKPLPHPRFAPSYSAHPLRNRWGNYRISIKSTNFYKNF